MFSLELSLISPPLLPSFLLSFPPLFSPLLSSPLVSSPLLYKQHSMDIIDGHWKVSHLHSAHLWPCLEACLLDPNSAIPLAFTRAPINMEEVPSSQIRTRLLPPQISNASAYHKMSDLVFFFYQICMHPCRSNAMCMCLWVYSCTRTTYTVWMHSPEQQCLIHHSYCSAEQKWWHRCWLTANIQRYCTYKNLSSSEVMGVVTA